MPRLKNETFGTGDMSWLGSSHGIAECRTELLDISTFSSNTNYPNGYIPSGTPVAKVGGVLVPYDSTEGTTTNAGVLAGFILTDQPVVGTNDFAVPVLDHGRVVSARVPAGAQAFAAPVAAAKKAATTVVYI
jgi:hypothetical protein